MHDVDAWTYIKQLVAAGLVPSEAEAHTDIALVHQEHGFAYPCDWLQLGLFDGYRSAWLAGTDRGNLFITEFELNSKLEWSSTEDFQRENELVGVRRDGVEVYRNKKTGEKRYIGRPFRPARKWWQIWKNPGQVLVDSSNHNDIFKAAWNLIKPYITHQLPDPALRGAARKDLKRARKMFLSIIAFNPANWSAHWALGIANKCLRDLPSAYMAFENAYRLEKEQPDVGRELSGICICRLDCGRSQWTRPQTTPIPAGEVKSRDLHALNGKSKRQKIPTCSNDQISRAYPARCKALRADSIDVWLSTFGATRTGGKV